MPDLAEIRAEYERSIPDAYAGGPAARAQAWQRLATLIQAYADDQQTPTIAETANTVAEPATSKPAPNRHTAPRRTR